MAEEEIKKEEGNGKVEEQKPNDLILTITLKADGNLQVQGPGNSVVYDEPMCDYLMKKAGRFIEAHNARALQSKIIRPTIRQRLGGAFGRR